MFAVIAAVIFGLGLLMDLLDVKPSDAFTPTTIMMAGLFCLALHLTGVGATTTWRSRVRARR